jgi:hypothetical protein
LSEITKAIETKQTQITQLQSDIETLQRAAIMLGGKKAPAKAVQQKAPSQPTAKAKRKRAPMSAANRKAMSRRLKAFWAKRRKAKG